MAEWLLRLLRSRLGQLFSTPWLAPHHELPLDDVWLALNRPDEFIAITPVGRWRIIRHHGDGDFLMVTWDVDDNSLYRVDFSSLYSRGEVSWFYPVMLPWSNMGFMGALSGGAGYIRLENQHSRRMVTELMS